MMANSNLQRLAERARLDKYVLPPLAKIPQAPHFERTDLDDA